jgi:3D (Asp-Asp-Asp) domain-containing protein
VTCAHAVPRTAPRGAARAARHDLLATGLLAALAVFASACATLGSPGRPLVVTATAYNSLPAQTDRHPDLAAWGDRLRPGMRAVAVSPDLLSLGLVRGTRVRIEGLRGEYAVLDKTSSRWRRRIDIYMGRDRRAALRWGKRTVRIHWRPPDEKSDWGFFCFLNGSCG